MVKKNNIYYKSKEEWIHWIPCSGLVDNYYWNYFEGSSSSLKIELISATSKKQTVAITCNRVYSYHSIEENCTLRLLDHLLSTYGEDFISLTSFFKIKNSEYQQSIEQAVEKLCTHYVIYAVDRTIHLIADREPIVKILN